MARTLYLTEQGATLSRRGERLVVERAGETLADVPAAKVLRVFVFGNVSLTTPAIAYLLREGKEVAFLSSRGCYYGRLISAESKNPMLRRAQLRAADDPAVCLDLSRRVVLGKLKNQRRLLHRRPGPKASAAAEEITSLIGKAETTGNLGALRGIEGLAARAYFGAFGELLDKMAFTGRRRRPPPDPVNSLLSLGYTLLTYEAFSAVASVGFDPYIGFFHADTYGRPSLALDIMEEFRPAVVDTLVLGAVNRGNIRAEDFEVGEEDGKRCYRLTAFLTRTSDGFGARFSRITKSPTEPQCETDTGGGIEAIQDMLHELPRHIAVTEEIARGVAERAED